jgi:hypothetical protein
MKVDNCQDVLDSRDIIERIKELEEIFSDWKTESEDFAELKTLKNLEEQGKNSADWNYGETLIRESYFVEYIKEMLADCGVIPSNLPFYIENNIDWSGVAEDLKVDYMEIDFDGVTYFMRA